MSRDKKIIYLAEDDEDDRMIFEGVITGISGNIEVHTVEDGNKLMSKLFSDDYLTPDLIILDLNMPNLNGKETLKHIRSYRRFDKIPVIIYSTSTSSIDIDETFRDGANLYMEKPYDVEHLAQVLTIIVKKDWEGHFPPPRENYFLSSKRSDS